MNTGWTIGRKLFVSFACVAGITLLLGLVGYYGVAKGGRAVSEIGAKRLPGVQNLLAIVASELKIKAAQRTYMNPNLSDDVRKRQPQNIAKAREDCQSACKTYEALPKTGEEAAIWREFVSTWEQWSKETDEFLKLNGELEALDILNPSDLQRDLQQFIGDHYKLTLAVMNHVETGAECKGGDDPTACNYGKWMAKFESVNPELKRIIDATRPSHEAFHAAVKKAKELAAAGDKEGGAGVIRGQMKESAGKTFEGFAAMLAEATKAKELYTNMDRQMMVVSRDSQLKVEDFLARMNDTNQRAAADTVKASEAMAAFLEILAVIAMVVGVAAALGLGVLISRGINKALRRIAADLGNGAGQTASAAGQVAQSSQSMAEGASEQASSLEETSASLEEMTSMTRQNADHANQAKNLSGEANASAGKGVQAMAKMGAAIDDIKKSADATAKIIKTIDEIAFQTNLLALNAAVEAARAGDAGKGFAVVAEEVRNLAQRSAEAAKNTAAMIEESVKNAENGVQISREVGATLEEIAGAASKVNALVAEIASASNEQAKGIEQVNTAVAQMDQVTQSNAANSEEAASASEELNAQAEATNRIVQELVAMVGGAGALGRASNPPAIPEKAGVAPRKPAVTNRRRAALPAPAAAGRAVVKPEQIIPLDDADLGDF